MDVMKELSASGIIPVVVLEKQEHAVPTANALIAGGLRVMEITFRTAVARDCIQLVSAECPDMIVGAGTVTTVSQCQDAIEAGAHFIVTPGFDPEVAAWCVKRQIPVIPGCVTPSEIMGAMKLGLNVLKFFPANVYGGLETMKALSGPFSGVKFVPTGGVNGDNVGAYLASPYVFAVGGSWVCSKGDIVAGRFDRITALSQKGRETALGFVVSHMGINCQTPEESMSVCGKLERAFGFPIREGNSSCFSSPQIEVMKAAPCFGEHGHIAVQTNAIYMAVAELKRRGFEADFSTAKYKNDAMCAVYLKESFGGFAIHLLQK